MTNYCDWTHISDELRSAADLADRAGPHVGKVGRESGANRHQRLSYFSTNPRLAFVHVTEDEPVSRHDLADLDVEWGPKAPGPSHTKVWNSAALAARVYPFGKFAEQLGVDVATGEVGVQLSGVDAGDHCSSQARLEHRSRQHIGWAVPEREDRGDPRSGEAFFSIDANVAEEQVPEEDVSNSVSERRGEGLSQARFVHLVRTGRRNLDNDKRQTETICLSFEQRSSDRVHRDPICVGVHRGQEGGDLDVAA